MPLTLILTMKNDDRARPIYVETDEPDFDALAKAVTAGAPIIGQRVFASQVEPRVFVVRERTPFVAMGGSVASIQLATSSFTDAA